MIVLFCFAVKQCFEALGNLLQKRRKQDLLDIHADFIACTEDPAEKDDSLQTILQVNQKQGEEKLSKLCTEWVFCNHEEVYLIA